MKRLIVLFAFCAAAVFGQTVQCTPTPTSPWSGCTVIPTVQIAKVGGTAQVNTKASSGSGTTITNAFPGSTTKGNSILCLGLESAAAIPVVTDAQSNAYVVAKSSATAPGYTISMATNIVGGTTDTITLTVTSGAAYFACYELQGTPVIGQIWDAFDGQQGTAASVTFTPLSTRVPNEMTFAAVGFNAGTVNATPTLGAPVSGLVTVDSSNVSVTGGSALAVAYAAHTSLTDTAAFQPTISLSASETFSAVFVSIQPPASVTDTNGSPTNTSYTAAGASTNATLVKAEPGVIRSITATNTTSTNYYLRLYNLAAAPTCSSATGFVETIPIFGAAANGGGIQISSISSSYSTGIGFCITGGAGSTDNTNAAVGVFVTIRFN